MGRYLTRRYVALDWDEAVRLAGLDQTPIQEIHALKVGSPPDWDNVPDEFKADLAALDRLEDEALWKIATARKTSEEMTRYDELFNPRTQQWSEHFAWSLDATKVQGTAIGRATVAALRMNNPIVVAARYRWAINDWHPPQDL